MATWVSCHTISTTLDPEILYKLKPNARLEYRKTAQIQVKFYGVKIIKHMKQRNSPYGICCENDYCTDSCWFLQNAVELRIEHAKVNNLKGTRRKVEADNVNLSKCKTLQ